MAGAAPLVGGVRTEGRGPSAATTERRTAAVPEGMCWVGLEVHANGTVCAVFDGATGGVGTRRLLGRPHELLGWLGRLRQPLRAVDVAGPTGYGRARRALGRGLDLRVCGPG